MKPRITNVYRWALVIGLVIRIVLAPITAHPWDTYVFYDTAQTILQGRDFYGATAYSYPPGWAGFLAVVGAFYRPLAAAWGAHPITSARVDQLIGVPVELGSPQLVDWLFLILMKTPLIVGDLALATLVRNVVARRFGRPDLANRAFAALFLNPYVIWISSAWGMFDVLPTYFALLGFMLFLDKRDLASGLAFGFATSLKYFPILLAFSLIIAYRNVLDRPRISRFGLGFAGVLGILSAPFLVWNFGAYVQGVLSPTSGSYVGRVSVWTIGDALGLLTIPLWVAAVDIATTLVLVALFAEAARRRSLANGAAHMWVEVSVGSLAVFYTVNYAVNPQYFFWIIPFVSLDLALGRGRPRGLLALTATMLTYIFVSVQHYSFFLPLLTIDVGLARAVPMMPSIPPLTFALAIAFWIEILALLWSLTRRLGGRAQLIQVAKDWIRIVPLPRRQRSCVRKAPPQEPVGDISDGHGR